MPVESEASVQPEELGPPVRRRGLFASKPPPPQMEIQNAAPQLNSLAARIRISEERYLELRKKMLVIEQNMLANHKRAITELKTLGSEITEMKRSIVQIEDRILTVIKEIKLGAKKEDVQVIKRYVELWNPVRFVTVEHVEKIIEEKMKEYLPKQKA